MGAELDALESSERFRLDRSVGANRTACTNVGTSTSAATSAPSPNGRCFPRHHDACRLTAAKRTFRNPIVHTGTVRQHRVLARQRLARSPSDGPALAGASQDPQYGCWPAATLRRVSRQSKVGVSQGLIAKGPSRTPSQVKSSPTWPETVGSLAIRSRHSSISAESRPTTLATASSSAARTAHWCIFGHGSSSASPSS